MEEEKLCFLNNPKVEKLLIHMFELNYDNAKSLLSHGKYIEAAESCNVILDKVESTLPEGVPENFATDYKLQEIISKAVELLPGVWKLSGNFHEAIASYRRALLRHWNLDKATIARIQKEFAVFLLYGGVDATPPKLRYQVEGSFVPKNNVEEAVLLLMILLRDSSLKRIEWDASIVDHLCFGLSVSGGLEGLAKQVEEFLPGVLERKLRYYTLSLCYHGMGEDVVALNLLRILLSKSENPNCIKGLLLASKICGENPNYAVEGVDYAHRALTELHGGCPQMASIANCLLGISLSDEARCSVMDSERVKKHFEALQALKTAERTMIERIPKIIYHLSLENADQRNLDVALSYAKQLLKLEGESSLDGWILVARILSAQKRYSDAENVIDAALDQTGKWSQKDLLRTKAKLQIAQGRAKNAVETCTLLLALIHVQSRRTGVLSKGNRSHERSLELEIWIDLAKIYISLSQWRDAEVCLCKSKAISPHSASRWHAVGLLYQAKSLHKEALDAFVEALGNQDTYVPSLISTANILRQKGNNQSVSLAETYLSAAVQLDRMNHSAWSSLGLVYKQRGKDYKATECFEAAEVLEESAPVEPFR
ncbi:protein NPGR2-like [Papaver somniferum]|uniref:protein NPGR2-like n=1 Tax=Papaver somniferum TaxID=3469 RepID=UPI000E6F695D|nr:protein NPGR2-like [Papaver somniferum]